MAPYSRIGRTVIRQRLSGGACARPYAAEDSGITKKNNPVLIARAATIGARAVRFRDWPLKEYCSSRGENLCAVHTGD